MRKFIYGVRAMYSHHECVCNLCLSVCKCHCVSVYIQDIIFLELLTAVTGAFPSWQECRFGENSVACVWRTSNVESIRTRGFTSWSRNCSATTTESDALEFVCILSSWKWTKMGPLVLPNQTSVYVYVCVCVHVCAEGRTRQWECIKENIVYKTSGVVVF